MSIDSNGDIAGATMIGGVPYAYYLPNGGTATVLPVLDPNNLGSVAFGVNGSGTVVGYSCDGTYVSDGNTVSSENAFVWSAATGMVDLGTPGVPSYASGISADGKTIIGSVGLVQSVKWTLSGSTWTMTPLVQPSQYYQSIPYSVNSSGVAVGGAFDYPEGGVPNPAQTALEFKPDGTVVTLGGLGGSTSNATGINNNGVIVGYNGTSPWINYTGLPGANINLNALLSPVSGAGWTLKAGALSSLGWGIDNNGNIVGTGKTPAGGTHAVLLTPALPGDANLDGKVNINDLTVVLSHYGQTGMTWTQGEFTGDGTVDINDLTIVLANYDKSAGSSAASLATVPEPSALLLAAVASMGLTAALWRKRSDNQKKRR